MEIKINGKMFGESSILESSNTHIRFTVEGMEDIDLLELFPSQAEYHPKWIHQVIFNGNFSYVRLEWGDAVVEGIFRIGFVMENSKYKTIELRTKKWIRTE